VKHCDQILEESSNQQEQRDFYTKHSALIDQIIRETAVELDVE